MLLILLLLNIEGKFLWNLPLYSVHFYVLYKYNSKLLYVIKNNIHNQKLKTTKNNMSEYINELIKIGYFVGMSFVLALILLVAVYVLSFTSKVDFEKSSAYECGFQPFSETNYLLRFNLH